MLQGTRVAARAMPVLVMAVAFVLGSAPMSELSAWWQLLQQPAYRHVLLNPLPVYGLAMGAVALVLALIFREKRAHTVALVIVALACVAVWPVIETGERAGQEIGADATPWLHEHEERAEAGAWVLYLTAALAIVALIGHWTMPRIAVKLTGVVLVASLASLGVAAWISKAGGQIRHEEFRARSATQEVETQHEH